MLCAVLLTVLAAVGGTVLALCLWLDSDKLTMLAAMDLMEEVYVGEYHQDTVVEGAMDGMVAGLDDRWSRYMTAEELAEQNIRRANEYVGIGVTVSYELPEGLLVTDVAEGGPADQAGILPGEVILSADGVALVGDDQANGANIIRGEEGTAVALTVRGSDGEVRELSVVRAALWTSPVTTALLDSGVGYLRLENFYTDSARCTQEAVEELLDQGATGIIFDVRANPGGYIDELTDLLDYLLPEGPIFASHSRDGEDNVVMSDSDSVDIPMVVLVDENTYSAAELFAAQLRESAQVPIVGQNTTGKGRSQQTYSLPNGGAISISTAQYTTGGGHSLADTGITPDHVVALGTDGEDAQLAKAEELLSGTP